MSASRACTRTCIRASGRAGRSACAFCTGRAADHVASLQQLFCATAGATKEAVRRLLAGSVAAAPALLNALAHVSHRGVSCARADPSAGGRHGERDAVLLAGGAGHGRGRRTTTPCRARLPRTARKAAIPAAGCRGGSAPCVPALQHGLGAHQGDGRVVGGRRVGAWPSGPTFCRFGRTATRRGCACTAWTPCSTTRCTRSTRAQNSLVSCPRRRSCAHSVRRSRTCRRAS